MRSDYESKTARGPLVVLAMALFVAVLVVAIWLTARAMTGPGKVERAKPTFQKPGGH